MAFNYTDMLGNMFGGMAKSLGYGDMVIQPRKPNGPPTKQLLPSEIAAGDMMHGMNAGMEDMQMPSMQATHSMLPHLLSYHAYGGPLDPRKINIVGEQGPEAVVGQQVIPLDQQIVNREQGQIMQPPVQQIVNPAPAQIPLPLGLAQTEQDDQRDNTQGTWQPGQATQQQTTQQQASPEDALRQQIMETLQGSTKRSPWADLGVSLVQAGDNWFNKKNEPIKTWAQIQADKKLRGLLPQYQLAQEASAAKTAAEMKAAAIAKSQAEATEQNARARKLDADILSQQAADKLKGLDWEKEVFQNKVYKKFKDGHVEPLINPETNQQMTLEERMNVPIPGMGGVASVRPDVALTNQTNLAVGNAQRQQSADQTNAEKAFEAQKTNVANSIQYANSVTALLGKIGSTNAEILSANPVLQSSAQRMVDLAGRAQQIADNYSQEMSKAETQRDPKVLESLEKQMRDTQDDLAKEQTGFAKTMGQVQGGKEMLNQLKGMMPQKPARVTYTPFKAVQVNPSSIPSVSESVFKRRLLANGIKDPAKQKALITQARTDGVIK